MKKRKLLLIVLGLNVPALCFFTWLAMRSEHPVIKSVFEMKPAFRLVAVEHCETSAECKFRTLVEQRRSVLPGVHEFDLFMDGRQHTAPSPGSLGVLTWAVSSVSRCNHDGSSLETSPVCRIALRFSNKKYDGLSGIGFYDEDGFTDVQTFSPVLLVPGRVYWISDAAHGGGLECTFRTTESGVQFGVYGRIDRPFAGMPATQTF